MAGFKLPDFNDRATASRAAKQKLLDQRRDPPAPDPAEVAERQAARAAREAAAAERRAARQLALEEAKAAKLASKAPAPEEIEPEPAPAKIVRSEAELKAARDARYAARKSRKR
jgi:hypothetical protein